MANEVHIASNLSLPSPEVIECPSRNFQETRTLLQLPREGWFWLFATLVMFMTGLFKGINLLVLLAYLLGGIWLLNFVILRSSIRRLRGRRIPLEPIFAGDTVACSIELTCEGKRFVRGFVVVDHGPAHVRTWMVLSLSPTSPLRIQSRETFPKRGRYGVHALRATSSFPFGLTVRSIDLAPATEWIILPRLGRVNVDQLKHWLARIQRGDGRMHRRQLSPVAQEADVHGLRDFRTGDSPRWIHWRTSARRNQLLVREFEDSSQPRLVMVVEPYLPKEPSQSDQERLEKIVSLTGTIVREWCRDLSSRLTLIVADDGPTVRENGTGREFALHLLEVLALQVGRDKANTVQLLTEVSRVTHQSPVLVLSSKVDSILHSDVSGELGRPVAHLETNNLPSWYDEPSMANG